MAYKGADRRIHEMLHEQLNLLTLIYPPSKDFNAVFKINMFVKSNKAASHQVIYYLLNILDPQMLKQKVISWPLYDIKSESQFRNEVMKYVNELNKIYPGANIPPVITSHLISPGGYKFARFILQLSKLVISNYLNTKIDESEFLKPISSCSNKLTTAINLKNLKSVSNKNHEENIKTKLDFNTEFKNYKIEADHILQLLIEVNKRLPELQEKLKELQSIDFKIDFEECNNRLKKLSESADKLTQIYSIFDNASRSATNQQGCLEFRADEISDLNYAVNKNTNSLNIIKFCECYQTLLKRLFYEIKPVNSKEIQFFIDTYLTVELDYRLVVKRLEAVFELYQSLMTSMNEIPVLKTKKIVLSDSTESIYALPLEDSETKII